MSRGLIPRPGVGAAGTGFTVSSNNAANNDCQINDKTQTQSLSSVVSGNGIIVSGSTTAANNRLYTATQTPISGDAIRMTPQLALNDLNNAAITLERVQQNYQQISAGDSFCFPLGDAGLDVDLPVAFSSALGTTYEVVIVGD